MLAGRRQHGRGHRRAEAPDHRLVRQPSQQHVGMGLLDIVERGRDAELGGGKPRGFLLRCRAGEARHAVERQHHLEGAAAHRLALHLGLELAPLRRVVDQRQHGRMWTDRRDDDRRLVFLAARGDHAAHLAAADADRGDRLAGHDRAALGHDAEAQRLDDGTHAADRKAGRATQRDQPWILRATVAQRGQRQRPHHQVERRAGRRRRDLAADHGERRDQGLGFRRQFELVHEVAGIAEQNAAEGFLVFQARQVAHEMLQRGRRLEDRDAQPVGEALEIGEEGVVAGGFAGREGFQLGVIARRIAPADVDPVAVQRMHQGRVGAHEGETVTLELEIVDDLGFERARRVGDGRRIAGHELDGRRRAAQAGAAFEDQGPEAGATEIGGGDEPVMAAAHDDGLVAAGAHFGTTSLV